ncbi:MAG: acyl carrier protein [Bacteroidia bacterium]|jgi:acyl carrier protein
MITIAEFNSKLKDEFIVGLRDEYDEIELEEITPETKLAEALELSSLNILLLMAFLKTEFDLNVTAKSIAACGTVAELHQLVVARLTE